MTHVRILAFSIGLLLVAMPAFADTAASVNVPDHCTVVDTDRVSHSYSGQYFGICALQSAIDSDAVSGVQFSNAFPSLGLFVTSVGGVAADPDSQYWALYHNGGFASLGLSQLPVAAGDTLTLELHDFSDTFLGSRFTLTIASLMASANQNVSSGGKPPGPPTFSVTNALSFLQSKQQTPGNFGPEMITDWAAIALASAQQSGTLDAIRRYLLLQVPTLTSVTDYERHTMALEALGIDPYVGTPVDYITPILLAFDGTQIGNPMLVNDDIFALVTLSKAGYRLSDEVIQKTLAFVLSRQHADGSWEESVDLTGAAMQSLHQFDTDAASSSVAKARMYLKEQQGSTGGWGNSFSTSWALQGLAALGESPSAWAKGNYTPLTFLGYAQLPDGGVEPTSAGNNTRIWATAYAIPAALAKPWNAILQDFTRPTTTSASAPSPVSIATSAASAASTSDITTTETIASPTSPTILLPITVLPSSNSPAERADRSAQSAAIVAGSSTTEISPQTQVAAASLPARAEETVKRSNNWVWLIGLVLVLLGTYYFFRRA